MYGPCAKLFPFTHNHAVMSLSKTGRCGNDFGILVINDLADRFDGGRRHDKKIRNYVEYSGRKIFIIFWQFIFNKSLR